MDEVEVGVPWLRNQIRQRKENREARAKEPKKAKAKTTATKMSIP